VSTPDKCPHCGSKFTFGSTLWFECNTHVRGKQSKTCERLCELTATKANLADALADAASWQKQADDRLNDAVEFGRRAEKAEARVMELEASGEEWELRALGGEYAAQMLRKACGLDDTKEDLRDVALLFDKLNARVKELEGLKCRRVGIGLDGFYAAFVIETKVEPVVGVTTLGDAMPRKDP